MQLSGHLDPFSEGEPLNDVAEESFIYHENLEQFMLLICLNYNSMGSNVSPSQSKVEVVVILLTNI